MCTSRIRATYALGKVLTFEQRHTSVSTDFSHGFGEIITSLAAKLPVGDLTFSESILLLAQTVPYNFGVVTQLLNEVDKGFNTASMRNIYSPDVACARELVVDQLAKGMRKDPYRFRREFIRNDRARPHVGQRVADRGRTRCDRHQGRACVGSDSCRARPNAFCAGGLQ